MKLYSTKNEDFIVDLEEAVMNSLAPEGGLYMPSKLTPLPESFWANFYKRSFQENSYLVCSHLFDGYIPEDILKDIVYEAINFPAPLVQMSDSDIYSLELWHGPSLAFKDFGARFMSRLMSYFNRNNDNDLTILVATSGDTGGAVATGFYNTPGIEVIILYPSGKVSHLQEKQLTTLGKNITALEIDGTFDDCQALVKQAFLDEHLREKYRLSSANSINIARLIPQSFYYFEAIKQLGPIDKPITMSIPSGNFGNLTAGLIAKRLGLKIDQFIAATNINNIVPKYLETGVYEPKPSIATISNAMDVGRPSNFDRMMALYSSTWNDVKKDISGAFYTDEKNKEILKDIKTQHGYVADPHGALGYQSLVENKTDTVKIYFETAHPAKFINVMDETIGVGMTPVPERLAKLRHEEKTSIELGKEYTSFKKYLLER